MKIYKIFIGCPCRPEKEKGRGVKMIEVVKDNLNGQITIRVIGPDASTIDQLQKLGFQYSKNNPGFTVGYIYWVNGTHPRVPATLDINPIWIDLLKEVPLPLVEEEIGFAD